MNTVLDKKEFQKEFKQLFDKEIEFREKFRKARKELEDLVNPITEHVNNCVKFWNRNIPNDVEKVIIVIKNEDGTQTALELLKPKFEPATVESYLPFGIDFNQASIIDCL